MPSQSARVHSLSSMLLFTAAVLLAMVVIARASWLGVAGFVVVNLLSTLGIAYTYCAKCACRRHGCSHGLIGKTADLLPRRAPAPYTWADYLGMFASAGIVFLYPLPWLRHAPAYLIAFLVIGGLGALEILLAVCPHCSNTRCPAARWRTRLHPGTADGDEGMQMGTITGDTDLQEPS